MPHVNMIYPFIPVKNFPDVVKELKESIKNIQPFKCILKQFNYFKHKSDVAMWLKPETEEPQQFLSVQKALENVVPYCDDLSKKSKDGFTPHLSVGQFPTKDANKFLKELQSNWNTIEFTVREVLLIGRSGFEDPFEVYYKVPFGDAPIEEIKTITKFEELKNTISVFIGNLPLNITEDEIEKAFLEKDISPISIFLPKNQGKPKGFGFIEFKKEDHQKALLLHQNLSFSGRLATIQLNLKKK